MEITGTLVHLLPVQTGQGRNGQWKKQDFVIEIPGNFPKKVCFSTWGDKIEAASLVVGQMVKVSFDVESREYNDRWYTTLKAYSIQTATETGYRNVPPPPLNEDVIIESVSDDLPF